MQSSPSPSAFSALDLPLMCNAFPLFRAKCAAIESTEHYGSEQRVILQQELAELEEQNAQANRGFDEQEEKLKTEVANLEKLLKRIPAKKTADEERLSIAAMKRLVER